MTENTTEKNLLPTKIDLRPSIERLVSSCPYFRKYLLFGGRTKLKEKCHSCWSSNIFSSILGVHPNTDRLQVSTF